MGCQLLVITLSDNCHLPLVFWSFAINVAYKAAGGSDMIKEPYISAVILWFFLNPQASIFAILWMSVG